MKKYKFIFFLILTIAWLGVIYSFSLEPADVSDDTSFGLISWIVEHFLPFLEDTMVQLSESQMRFWHNLVRKMAHFTEYAILGTLSMLTGWQIRSKALWHEIAGSILFCMAAASIDETIQLFVDGRAGRVSDVLIDSGGAIVGISTVLLSVRLYKHRRGNVR